MFKEPIKKIILGLGVAGIAAIIGFIPVNPEPLTVNEWQVLVKIYDYEIERVGGTIQMRDFTNQNAIEKLNKEIKKRIPTEKVEIDGQEMASQEYKTFRDNLLEKTERSSLIKKIIKLN